jgi:hypothetical protein
MKRLGIFIIAILLASPVFGRQVKVKERVDINPDIKVDVKTLIDHNMKVNINISPDIDLDFDFDNDEDFDMDDNGNWDSSGYQQDEQEIEIPLSSPGERGVLKVESHNGSVTINGYGGQTVKVKMIKYSKKVDKNKTKDGMKLVSSGGFNVEAQEYNNRVNVENEGWNNRVDFVIQVPKNFDIKAETYNNGKLVVTDIDGEVDVENYNGPIELDGISGVASASTYNGAIIVAFTSVTPDKPMSFSTYNGKIDLTLPASAKITAKMKTAREIYTDFENFSMEQTSPTKETGKNGRGYSIKYENWIQGALNGGGADVSMQTRNGDIYIRKGN